MTYAPSSSPHPPTSAISDVLRGLPEMYWRVQTHPSPATFVAESQWANWRVIWIQLATWGILSGVLGFFARLMQPIPTIGFDQGMLRIGSQVTYRVNPAAALGDIVWVPLGFLFVMGIIYLLARALGGQGTYMVQAYVSLLFAVPLGLAGTILGAVPFTGLVTFAVSIYGVVLQVQAVMAVHRLNSGVASLAIFLPIVLLMVLAVLLALTIAGFVLFILGLTR